MKFIMLISIASFAASLKAKTAEETYLLRLQAVRTQAQMRLLQNQREELSRDKRICDFQLLQSVVPWACYRRLKIEQDWRVISPVDANESQTKLDQLCIKAVRTALRRSVQDLKVPDRELSQACREKLIEARDISHYRSNEIFSNSIGAEIEGNSAL